MRNKQKIGYIILNYIIYINLNKKTKIYIQKDLDAAMLSRLDLSIKFELPDELSRAAIFQRYAKHLSDDERRDLANHTMGMSGRNIADVCKGNNDSKKKIFIIMKIQMLKEDGLLN